MMNLFIGSLLSTCLLMSSQAQAAPTGIIDQVSLDNGRWTVRGWACEPGNASSIQVELFVGGYSVGRFNTTEPTEEEVRAACGTQGSGVSHRFAASYYVPANNQSIAVGAHGQGFSWLVGSFEFSLPRHDQHPLARLQASSRILIYTAHPDDEILFAPVLGELCAMNFGRTCKIVVATQGGGPGSICLTCQPGQSTEAVRSSEMVTVASRFPLVLTQGALSADGGRGIDQAIAAWNAELAASGGLNGQIHSDIRSFSPDAIVTFDPRRGVSCHNEHRAVGEAVKRAVDAYGYDKSRVFFLTTRREGVALVPNVPRDNTSVVYTASNYFYSTSPAFPYGRWFSGWDFTVELLRVHASQFEPGTDQAAYATPMIDRNTAFQAYSDYVNDDPRYKNCSP